MEVSSTSLTEQIQLLCSMHREIVELKDQQIHSLEQRLLNAHKSFEWYRNKLRNLNYSYSELPPSF